MTKEEILARSRGEGNREYEDKVSFDAMGRSVWVLAGICIFFALVKIVLSDLRGLEKVIPFWEFPAILFAHSSVTRLYMYNALKSKSDLTFGALSALLFIICTFFYVVTL
ncbi:MAG: hypothetical protein GX251_10860 [Firmicutes bacterium]|nr:hypothetical protein [Bacillota bacterium]